jgi:hypothetical protein
MPIVQATHINHVHDGSVQPPADAAEHLAFVADAETRKKPEFFVRNPKLIAEDAVALIATFDRGRNGLDGAGRLAQAEQWKAGANVLFQQGKPQAVRARPCLATVP